jgi:hypothetical protein
MIQYVCILPSVERLTEALHEANHPGYQHDPDRFDTCRGEAERLLAILRKLATELNLSSSDQPA